MDNTRLVLAIDSSLACPAFAVLLFDLDNRTVEVVQLAHVKTNSKKPTGYRLDQIDHVLDKLTYTYSFDEVVMEKGFNKFATATQQIQRTVGLLLFRMWTWKGYEIAEISPTTVKKVLTGSGKASKEEVAEALERYVGKIKYANNDESDATGVGIAYGKQKGWL
ncbi:crossover junction endodeoxyribonuclease RuvC [Bacillus sp. Bos-x628]|uniref:crossover junction endodeoxyribonuclease RuvC n=1 Tax=Bacillus maqinnsis TaxID=3229854 RepID=UPI00338EA31B